MPDSGSSPITRPRSAATRQRQQQPNHQEGAVGMSDESMVAMITGANSGVGFGIAHRLLAHHYKGECIDECGRVVRAKKKTQASPAPARALTLILACRNNTRAEAAKKDLLKDYPQAQIEILLVDTSSPQSIKSASAEALERFPRINHLFCNAGIMPVDKLHWGAIFHDFFFDPIDLFTVASHAFSQPIGMKNEQGKGHVFMTNTAGHYFLIRALEASLVGGHAKVIFTSSGTANSCHFDINDIHCLKGTHPYQSSKYALDMLTLALNKRLGSRGVQFFTTCPGTVYTPIVPLPIPRFVMLLALVFVRIFISSLTLFPETGATAAIFLALGPSQDAEAKIKYFSRSSSFGKGFVMSKPIAAADAVSEADMGAVAQKVEDECLGLMREYYPESM